MPGSNASNINKQLTAIFKQNDTDPDDAKILHRLQTLSDVHTNPDYGGSVNKSTINNLILLAVFLLLLRRNQFHKLIYSTCSRKSKRNRHKKNIGK